MEPTDRMNKNDLSIRKMAKYLREGARMLDLACPECNNPVFQMKNGDKACVVCERKILYESEYKELERDKTQEIEKSYEKSIPSSNSTSNQTIENNETSLRVLSELKATTMNKLSLLCNHLKISENNEELYLITSNILKLLEILEKLKLY
ncbi:MAG: Sjogren's syndrome/scleroderma autoantigen 1 family protein [Candidatus Hodarchaeota archaeon]